MLSAIEYCHERGVVHRDLKAENLLLDATNRIKLADFGFSNRFTKDVLLSTFCGSPPYAAPEVFEGRAYFGPQIDVWSLGVVLYVMVCGSMPFEGQTIHTLRDKVLTGRYRIPYYMSTDCEHLIRRMLCVDPSKRATLAQIKTHRWMQKDNIQERIELEIEAHRRLSHEIKPRQACLRVMLDMGIDEQRIHESLKSGAFDHIAAIYHLLMERYRNRNFAASVQLLEEEREKWRAFIRSQSTEELTQRMEQMPGPTDRTSQNKNAESPPKERSSSVEGILDSPSVSSLDHPLASPPPSGATYVGKIRPRPYLRSLRDQPHFHQQQPARHPYFASNSADTTSSYGSGSCCDSPTSSFSRQSTVGSISADEGIHSDASGSCGTAHFANPGYARNDVQMQLASMEGECLEEGDLNCSTSSYVGNRIDGSQASQASPPTLVNCSANFCAEAQIGNGKVKLARRCSFGDGLRASDNTMLRSLEQSTAFPTGKLKRKARGIAELHSRPSTENMNKKMGSMKISKGAVEKKSVTMRGIPSGSGTFIKRVSLPERMEYHPQEYLNYKHSKELEMKIVSDGVTGNCPIGPISQMAGESATRLHKTRLAQYKMRQINKNRINLIKQQQLRHQNYERVILARQQAPSFNFQEESEKETES
ncbi:hypothetical protein WR25_04307 [Diploscapter pachys]|uniref:Protein kinase domain-containing protein n=1 Tax=Diploscapter pachys TaxID=2018661 RepID=A0A2A2LDE2_9BILA|nr:hypothetical protein WR25_04307 [Diploscapter pachys]